ncbi:MAG: zinc ribbon domain-containing protein [Lachnospiraceae bacterium]|nr:zinc ribbon domain-containing protein [Lachnospiraceae bacterium]
MYCGKCGAKAPDDAKKCPECGTSFEGYGDQLPAGGIDNEKSRNKEKRKHRFAKGLVLFLLVLLCIAGAFVGGTIYSRTYAGSASIEGPGFKTAKSAMQAFAKAFAEKDIDKMYSCCAVESYVENYDYEKYLERLQAYIPNNVVMTGDDETSRRINRGIRQNDLMRSFFYMYQYVSLPEDSFVLDIRPQSLDDMEVDDIIDELRGPERIKEIKLVDIKDPDKYIEIADADMVKRNYEANEKVFGGNIDSCAAKFEIDGEDWIMFADLIEYDGKWYVLYTGGVYGAIGGLAVNLGGIVREADLH